jgi:hypothetical protein
MIWVGWRQQRAEIVVAAAILAAIAAALVPSGLSILSAYHDAGLAGCTGRMATGQGTCGTRVDAFLLQYDGLGKLIAWMTLVPGLIGVLLAAPFVSQLEHGTHRLDWTQGVTRGRWLAGKLGLAVLSAVVASVLFIALITWWRHPLVHLQGRMDASVYDSEGIVAVGYTLFALALGTAIGAIWRRAVPALVCAFGAYFAVRLFVDLWLRQRLVEPVQRTWSTRGKVPDLDHAWIVRQFPSDRHGHRLAGSEVLCGHGASGACAAPPSLKQPVGYFHAVYHPPSHFWPLQGIEFALFTGIAVVLLGGAAWWTARRIG